MRDKYNDPNNFNIKIESTNHCYYCYFFSANTGLWHRFAVTLKENKEKCFLVFRDIVMEVKLSESESWIKLVTSNYCKCDLWTTLLLGGKTFPIIEAFFFFWFWILAPFIHPVTWNQHNIYSHTSSTYHSVQGHRWLANWTPKTHPPS